MKKIIAVILCVILLFSMSSCKKDEKSSYVNFSFNYAYDNTNGKDVSTDALVLKSGDSSVSLDFASLEEKCDKSVLNDLKAGRIAACDIKVSGKYDMGEKPLCSVDDPEIVKLSVAKDYVIESLVFENVIRFSDSEYSKIFGDDYSTSEFSITLNNGEDVNCRLMDTSYDTLQAMRYVYGVLGEKNINDHISSIYHVELGLAGENSSLDPYMVCFEGETDDMYIIPYYSYTDGSCTYLGNFFANELNGNLRDVVLSYKK